MSKMDGIKVLNNGNPVNIINHEGFCFTVSPGSAKKGTCYATDKQVTLTDTEKKMPGVVVAQNRGMLFSSCRPVSGDFNIPTLDELNLIIVPEKSRTLKPVDDEETKILWVGDGEKAIKDVVGDGQGLHWFCHFDGTFADDLWLKIARFLYGGKGMLCPGLVTSIGCKVIDRWNIEREITMGNTLLLDESMVKGVGAYKSLEECKAHAEEWGLTTMMKQWQSGDHKAENKRLIGTQANAGNLQLTYEDIEELLKPEALEIWMSKFEKITWMKESKINTSRGRAIAARPDLLYNPLIMAMIDNKAGNSFRMLAQSKVKIEGRYMKMYQDIFAYDAVYVKGMDINEAAKLAAKTGLHGEIRVNPSFAGRHVVKDEDGVPHVKYAKEVHMDNKGLYVEAAIVRYPHGAPSETIVVKLYLDPVVPDDVIIFPLPVANDDGTIPVTRLYALRLQGADFDGDAVTAYTEKRWLEAQKRNIGKSYMIVPINTNKTEKDQTLVTDETWESFCQQKVNSLSNEVGLIATYLKYLLSQKADALRNGENVEVLNQLIADIACAMGDDIDEFKHGKANNSLNMFTVPGEKTETLYSPYFNRYTRKFRSAEDFDKSIYTPFGTEKKPGTGILDMFAVTTERLMKKAGLPIVKEVAKATDGTNRYYFTVHPVKWEAKEVDLYAVEHGEPQKSVSLPAELEAIYGIKPGTPFSAKELFQMLFRDHSANCRMLLNGSDYDENRDELIKIMTKINERYALAKVTIIVWTQKMKFERTGEKISAEEALKLFTTLMTQHAPKARSVIEVLTRTGKFKAADGTEYEKTVFSAMRVLNYFLDLCGDGLLLQKIEKPNFPEVSDKIMNAANVEEPDIAKAKEKARKELELIEKLIATLNQGEEDIEEQISKEELAEIMDDGSFWISKNDEDC